MPKRINCDTYVAHDYVRDNLRKKSKKKIIEELMEITNLSESTLTRLYYEVRSIYEGVEEEEEREIKVTYRGRERDFFKFDTSNLWREIKG